MRELKIAFNINIFFHLSFFSINPGITTTMILVSMMMIKRL